MLHPEVRVKVTINVARTDDEADRQARGEDVLAEVAEEEAVEAAPAAEALLYAQFTTKVRTTRTTPTRLRAQSGYEQRSASRRATAGR